MTMPTSTPTTPSFDDMSDQQKLLVMSIAINDLQTIQRKHHTILVEGNGVAPVLARLRDVEKFIANTQYWQRFIGGALIAQTITFGVAAIIYFIKLVPVLDKLSKMP